MMDDSARKSFTMDKPYTGPAPTEVAPADKPAVTAQPAGPVSLKLKYDGGGADSKWYVQEATIGAPAQYSSFRR